MFGAGAYLHDNFTAAILYILSYNKNKILGKKQMIEVL